MQHENNAIASLLLPQFSFYALFAVPVTFLYIPFSYFYSISFCFKLSSVLSFCSPFSLLMLNKLVSLTLFLRLFFSCGGGSSVACTFRVLPLNSSYFFHLNRFQKGRVSRFFSQTCYFPCYQLPPPTLTFLSWIICNVMKYIYIKSVCILCTSNPPTTLSTQMTSYKEDMHVSRIFYLKNAITVFV